MSRAMKTTMKIMRTAMETVKLQENHSETAMKTIKIGPWVLGSFGKSLDFM